MGTFGLTLANRGVIIGAVTVPELFDMAKRGEDSGAFDAVWVGDSLLAKPRLESITLLSALAVVTKKVRLAVGCMATFPHRHPALLAQQWASLDVISGGRAWLAVCLGGPNEQSPAQALEHKVMGIKDTERVAPARGRNHHSPQALPRGESIAQRPLLRIRRRYHSTPSRAESHADLDRQQSHRTYLERRRERSIPRGRERTAPRGEICGRLDDQQSHAGGI